jgi:hypothetical protein
VVGGASSEEFRTSAKKWEVTMQAVLGLVVLALFLFGAGSAGAADFYEGKKIRLIVSSSPGGGNDTYSRLLARNIGRHIPGNPTIIVAEGKKLGRDVDPTSGVDLQKMWKDSIGASPEDKAIVAQIFNPKGKK